MIAGFARRDISPPPGTPLMGWGAPAERLSTGVHDPLYARALALGQGSEQAVIVGLDLCFIGRDDNDRLNGLLAREFGLSPRQVMLCASHTHAGPAVGSYLDLAWSPPRQYTRQLTAAVVAAVGEALAARRPVRLSAGRGQTTLPVSRRQPRDGGIVNAPHLAGPVYDALPVVMLRDQDDDSPVALLFSASTHAVCFSGQDASADYPGAAMAALDAELGRPCSLFLAGMGGDSRPRPLVDGREWRRGPGEAETNEAGRSLAAEVSALLPGLAPFTPRLASALLESHWPLQPLTRTEYEAWARQPGSRARWAGDMLAQLEAGTLPAACPLLMHGLQLGEGLRLIALEGEPLHPYGALLESAFSTGLTIPVGYTGGEGMYLVATSMLAEGGYEPGSYWEYHQPGPLAPGMESVCLAGVAELGRRGVH